MSALPRGQIDAWTSWLDAVSGSTCATECRQATCCEDGIGEDRIRLDLHDGLSAKSSHGGVLSEDEDFAQSPQSIKHKVSSSSLLPASPGGVGPSAASSRTLPDPDKLLPAILDIVYRLRSPGASLQMLVGGDWCTLSQSELRQIDAHLADGAIVFSVLKQGVSHEIDFTNPAEPVLRIAKSNAIRKLRVLPESFPTSPSMNSMGSGRSRGKGSFSKARSRSQASMAADQASLGHSDAGEIPLEDDEPDYDELVEEQNKFGPQSRRGCAPQEQLSVLSGSAHAMTCFSELARHEERYCGEWAVFYHAYSLAALIYEVHASIAASLFQFRSEFASLPRILVHEFARIPDATSLLDKFDKAYVNDRKDHHPDYRKVGISAMCSLVALGPEACTPVVFLAGYSEKDLSFRGVLENVLESCYVPKRKIKKLASDIVALSEKHGLDVSQFGGRPCESGRAGHLLQIFIRRDLVDQLVYAAKPYGHVDQTRHPISQWLDGDNCTNFGQARLVAHPLWFMQASCVRMHVVSADPRFHKNRKQFQAELTSLLGVCLAEPALRESAAKGIFGGNLPSWFPFQAHAPGTDGDGSPRVNEARRGSRISATFAALGFGGARRGSQ